MGSVMRIRLEDLPAELERADERTKRAIAYGARAGAERARAFIVKETPTDMGQLRASWKVIQTYSGATEREIESSDGTLAELINDAPHAAMVEWGSKPHAISPDAWAALYEWVRRHFRGRHGEYRSGKMRGSKINPNRANSWSGPDPIITDITNAIAWKIRKFGTKPRLFVWSNTEMLKLLMATELVHAIDRAMRDARPGKV